MMVILGDPKNESSKSRPDRTRGAEVVKGIHYKLGWDQIEAGKKYRRGTAYENGSDEMLKSDPLSEKQPFPEFKKSDEYTLLIDTYGEYASEADIESWYLGASKEQVKR